MPYRLLEFIRKRKELFLVGIILLFYFAHKLFIYRLAIYTEECRDANVYLMFLKGMLPYRDFSTWTYGPFSFCFYPMIFRIFGANLVVFRLSYIIAGSLVVPLVYCLARRLMTPGWAGVAAFLSFVLIGVPRYTYNHIFATIAGLLALLFIVKFIEGGLIFHLFTAGIFAGIAILAKPLFMGLGILFSILVSMLILMFQKRPIREIKLNHLILIFSGAIAAVAPFIVYFAAHGALYKFLSIQIPLDRNWPYSLSHSLSGNFRFSFFTPLWFRTHWHIFRSILPYRVIFLHPLKWKRIFSDSYYSFLIHLPILAPLAIFLLNSFCLRGYNLISKKASTYILLFTVFSIFICAQPLLLFANAGKDFTMQMPFVLSVYFLFLINDKRLYRKSIFLRYTVVAFSACFIVYLSFLHLVRIPYLYNNRYTAPLSFERAKGIRVKQSEKDSYEYLDRFLSNNMRADEPIAVIGYYPHYSFLLNRENIFVDIECVWMKFSELAYSRGDGAAAVEIMKEQEGELIRRLRLKKPKCIISPVNYARKYFPERLRSYIEDNYVLVKTLAPTDVDIGTPGKVDIYRLKREQYEQIGS